MASKYLSSLSKNDYITLTKKLLTIQNNTCFICQELIDTDIQETNIDHIVPLANKGKDKEENFAVTHESCNKSKQDADLKIARILQKLTKIKNKVEANGKKTSLENILQFFGGSKNQFSYKILNDKIKYSFSEVGDNAIKETEIFTDNLSKEQFCFIEFPVEYLFHDNKINPRGLNKSISKLIKEFYIPNPQLHLSLARIDDNKIKIFDGQHKAVAQILLGTSKLVVRLFIDPNIPRLTETNVKAGSTLRQIAFDKSIMRQLNNSLYKDKVTQYQLEHNLAEDDFSFSEQNIVEYFRGDGANIKKYIMDSIKDSITKAKENKLFSYINFEGRTKELPLSYSSFDKTILSSLVKSSILKTNLNLKSQEGQNPRELEINQIVKVLNILASSIYINKFNPEVGTSRIEKNIVNGKDSKITDEHLIAFRLSKEEVIYNWMLYLKQVIKTYFANTGRMFDENKVFQNEFPKQLWINIENFINNLSQLPLWKDRSMANTVFSGKNTYDYWKSVFETGKSPDGASVLAKPLNFIEMIQE